MGLVGQAVVQVVLTSVFLGALKNAGVIRVEPKAIENPTVRAVFVQAVALGESMVEQGQELYHTLTKK